MPANPSPGRFLTVMPVMITLVVASLLAVCDGAVASTPAPNVTVSSAQQVQFTLELPEPTWHPAPAAEPADTAWDARLPGFVTSGRPGQPRLPRQGGWLVVPPGTVPRLDVVREQWRPLDGRRIALEAIPVMHEEPEAGRWSERPMLPRPDGQLPEDRIPAAVLADLGRPDPALAAGAAVTLGEVVWWRGRRVVPYSIMPLRLDSAGHATAALSDGAWRIRFVPDPDAGKDGPTAALRRQVGKGDEHFAGYFLNGALIDALPTEAAHLGVVHAGKARPQQRATTSGHPEIRIPVRRTQLHRVRAAELAAAGLMPATPIEAHQVRLYQRRYLAAFDDPGDGETPPYLEVEVPIHMVSVTGGFGANDQFLFWGLRPRDDGAFEVMQDGTPYALSAVGDDLEINNENNVYWLQFADPPTGGSWARMQQQSLPAAQGAPEVSYRRTDYYNEALAYRENVPAISEDRYYFNSASAMDARVSLSFWSPVPGQAGAVLRAGIANFFTGTRTLVLDLLQGETPAVTLPGYVANDRFVRTYETVLPTGVPGGENLTFRMRNSFTNLAVASYLDWVEVSYDALYVAPGGRLLFPGGDGVALGNLEVAGFATEDVGLIEVTDPRQPRWIELSRSNLLVDGSAVKLSLQVDQSGGPRRFYAASRMTSNGVVEIRYSDATNAPAEPVPPTRRQEARADVLVVVPPEFRAVAQAWIDYRRSRAQAGALTFQVVEPQQLYDWYSGGLKNPWAIKRLVNHALDNPAWGSYALVLVGTANENPREIGVTSSFRQWSRDWIPTNAHVQNAGFNLAPEVLGSDKWYANPAAGDEGFPNTTSQPTSLYVGRFPINNPEEMQRLLTKIQQTETVVPGEDWRRRAIFIADDAWSSGSLGAGGATMSYQPIEVIFETSQVEVLSQTWVDNGGLVGLSAENVLLRPFMAGLYPDPDAVVSLSAAVAWCRDSGAPANLIGALSRGGTLAHFQGHANHWLLTHEVWFEHNIATAFNRRDVDLLTNVGRPFFFHGMGCHLGDYLRDNSRNVEPGLGEKLLLWTDAGASAVYASSGYEFLHSNKDMSERFIARMMNRPPHVMVSGEVVTSRWRVGEVMWATEADVLAIHQNQLYRQMVYQYVLLGDPLMHLDCGLPEVEATLVGAGGGVLPDLQGNLVAIDPSGRRTVTVQARDEAGIDRLLLHASSGPDPTDAVITATPFYNTGSRQVMDYELDLPVRPFAHDLLVRIYDSGAVLDGDPHVLLTLRVEQDVAVITADDGQPHDPLQFAFPPGEPVPFELTVTSAAWFDASTTVALQGENLDLTGGGHTVVDNRTLRVQFTATAPDLGGEVDPERRAKAGVDRGVDLVIDGYTTYVALEASEVVAPRGGINGLVSFPNPMRDDTRFVFSTSARSGRGQVQVYTVSGRQVAAVPFVLDGSGQQVVPWNGRDREGGRLANGTYLYKVQMQTPGGSVRSDMQRLVIMR